MPKAFNLDFMPYRPTTREQWLQLCVNTYAQFQTLCEHGVLKHVKIHWVRIVPDHAHDPESQRIRKIHTGPTYPTSVDGVRHSIQPPGVPAGLVLTFQDRDGNWYAGASFCCRADRLRGRWSKPEAFHRALKSVQKVYVPVDFRQTIEEIPWLGHFPYSCRATVRFDMVNHQFVYNKGEPIKPVKADAVADDSVTGNQNIPAAEPQTD